LFSAPSGWKLGQKVLLLERIDPLIAPILAAAIYPIEIVEVGGWMQQG
jgi:hypothetical protein